MSIRSWQSELLHFRTMSQSEKLVWLSQLLHLISMFARDTYEVGTDGVSKPNNLRRFNELIHRIASFQKKIARPGSQGMPDEDFFELLQRELSVLDVAEDDVLSRLP